MAAARTPNRKMFYLRFEREILSKLPLDVTVRCLICAGAILRFSITYSIYATFYLWWWTIALTGLVIHTLVVTYQTLKDPDLIRNKRGFLFQILADTVIFSLLYFLTQSPESDLYLFYFLPLLIAAEHFKTREVIVLFLVISLAFLLVVLGLSLSPAIHVSMKDSLIRNALPRGAFFLLFLFLAFERGSRVRELAEELEAVRITAVMIARDEALQSRLEAIMEAATRFLSAKGCAVYLKIPQQDSLRLVALRGIESDVFRPGYILPAGKGIAGRVIKRRSPFIENDYSQSPYRIPELASLFEAVIEVPLIFREEALGVLAVFDNVKQRKFTEKDTPTLERLGQYAAVAIHDTQLYEQAQTQKRALEVLNASSAEMDAHLLDLNAILFSVAEHAWKLATIYSEKLPLFTCIGLLDEDKGHLSFRAAYPENHLAEICARVGRIDLNGRRIGIVGKAIKTKSSRFVPDITKDRDYIGYNPETRAQLAVLIKRGDCIHGVLSIEHIDHNAFSEELQRYVEILAAQAAAAIDNFALLRRNETQRQQAIGLHQASAAISSVYSLSEVANSILVELNRLIPHNRATLQIVDGDKREILAKRNLEDRQIDSRLLRPISEDRLIREIMERKEICILNPPNNNPNWDAFPTTVDIKSWIGIPLVHRDDVIALITVDQLEECLYSEDQKRLLELFASHASSVLQNAILSQQNTERVSELSRIKERLETTLDYLESQSNLALIGLVYGESIHYARNKLGMAKSRAANIVEGRYDEDPVKLKAQATGIIEFINSYLQILDNAQKQALSPIPTKIDLHEALDRVIQSKRISRAIKISKKYQVADPVVTAPEHQLRQVFYVIIQNALDAMGGEGTLGLETQLVVNDDTSLIKVSVSDTGPGIPEYRKETLFEMRETDSSRRDHRGIGIGLAWARSFMRSYGGDIGFETMPGKGTIMNALVPFDFRGPTTVR